MAEEAIRVLGTAILAFFVSLTITPPFIKFLRNFKLGKHERTSEAAPIVSGLHAGKEGTPTMGGVVVWGTVLILALAFLAMSWLFDGFWSSFNFIDRRQTYLPLVAMILGAVLGLADDVLGIVKKGGGLRIKHKLLVYTLLSALGAYWFYAPQHLDWHVLRIPFAGNFDIGIWYIPLFIFTIVATTFSANETDGLDGLLGGVSLFAFSALTAVAFSLGRYDLAAMDAAIVGALLAFLWFNINPAQFFMGDTGSMMLGVTLGITAMLTNTALLLPLFAVIFVVESLSVVIQIPSRKFFKRKVFLSTPIHHHFEALGWPESQVTMRFWIVSVVFAGLGLSVFFLDKIF